MPAKGWGSVSLPEELISDIDKYLESQKILYKSRNEFVRHAAINLLHKVGFYRDEETQDENPERKEFHVKGDISLQDFKAEMSGKTSPREKKKKSRVNPSLEEATSKTAVKG